MGLMVAVGVAEAISVVTVMESVAVVGAVLSAVGMVTKNKTLSMIGMGLGVIGGVGSLAAGALGGGAALFGTETAASVGGDTLAVSEVGSAAASGGVEAGTWTADAAASAAADVPDVVGTLAGEAGFSSAAEPFAATEAAMANPTTALAADAAKPLASTAANAADPAETLTLANETVDTVPADATDLIKPPPQPTANLGAADPTTGETITSAVDPTTGKVVDMPDGAKGIFGNLVAFAGKNPVVALGALQAGGSMLSGLTNTLTPAQVSALNAQAAANDAAASLTKQQTANLAMPKSVASSAPVTGTPAPLVPGMINRAPVTGVAA
jgi:hypothetical protein